MDIKSLEDLQRVDELTLRFSPVGFETGRELLPADAAVYQQRVIGHADLVPAVADETRNTFERIRSLHAYGVLSYEFFTAADDLAHLVIEQALRDRFMEFHGGVAPFEDVHETVHDVTAATFDALYFEIHRENRIRRPERWRLRLRRTGELIYFDGMLDSLLRWARSEGLLRGQRNRRLEPLLKSFRNDVAHGSGDHLVMPVDSALTISDAAEIINQLWGSPTPGGRVYPAPIQRGIQIVAWSPSGGRLISGPVGSEPPELPYAGWDCILVRAVLDDGGLTRFDAQFETTTYPCDLLWGPGKWEHAAAWLAGEEPAGDAVGVLDRLFLFQHSEGRLWMPRNPDVAAGLAEEERLGTWYLVRADFPADAIAHARNVAAGRCSPAAQPCGQCAAETVGTGTWEAVLDLVASEGTTVTARRPQDARVPSIRSWPRYFEIPDSELLDT